MKLKCNYSGYDVKQCPEIKAQYEFMKAQQIKEVEKGRLATIKELKELITNSIIRLTIHNPSLSRLAVSNYACNETKEQLIKKIELLGAGE